ncbi:hypothetical protein DCC79_04360 [bacterium]|nr:hypothetical protein [Chloroflexi bacterium CFX6]RIL11597.1 MAG: hypothetical protein DCC79_04360 [bacterium]
MDVRPPCRILEERIHSRKWRWHVKVVSCNAARRTCTTIVLLIRAAGKTHPVPAGGTSTWCSPLFGGGYAPGAADWLAVGAEGGPTLTDHSAAYVPDGDAMIVFGGRTGEATDIASGRVWRLDLASGAWEGYDIRVGPGPRHDHGAVCLPHLRWMPVYGGSLDGKNEVDTLYALDLGAAARRGGSRSSPRAGGRRR